MNKFLKILLISSVTFSLFSGLDEDLLAAARAGNSVEVEAAIRAGANINAVNNYGSAALMSAVLNGNINIVRLLLNRGANINAVNNYGITALMFAASEGHNDIVRLLLDRGADINATTYVFIASALMFAAEHGHADTVRLLLDGGANIDHVDRHGKTALMLAAQEGRADVVRLLLDRGDRDGRTALKVARTQSHAEIVKILKEVSEIKQLIDNTIQGYSSSHKKLIEKIKDLNIDSYEFNLILKRLINKIKSDGINKFSRNLLLDLAQHIAAALNSLGFDVIELPTDMLELILRRDVLPDADFNYQFEMARDEFNKPITEDLLGIVKALRFKKVQAISSRKQTCNLM